MKPSEIFPIIAFCMGLATFACTAVGYVWQDAWIDHAILKHEEPEARIVGSNVNKVRADLGLRPADCNDWEDVAESYFEIMKWSNEVH
jgi:hypothetical protein